MANPAVNPNATGVNPTANDPLSILTALADSGKYDSQDQSMYYMIMCLLAKINDISGQVTDMANESSAFSTITADIQKVNKDITRIQQWKTDHPNATMSDALLDPDFQGNVKAFQNDMNQLNSDNAKFCPEYTKDGSGESGQCADMINGTNITLPDGSSVNIGSALANNQFGSLAAALFTAAGSSTTSSGVFFNWTSSGTGGAPSLGTVGSDYGLFNQSLSQQLNVFGANLQQINGVGQNFNTAINSELNTIIANSKS